MSRHIVCEHSTRRIAASCVVFADGKKYRQHVVELIDSRVANHYALTAELPHTEWYGGTLLVDEGLQVSRLVTLADGTQRKQPL